MSSSKFIFVLVSVLVVGTEAAKPSRRPSSSPGESSTSDLETKDQCNKHMRSNSVGKNPQDAAEWIAKHAHVLKSVILGDKELDAIAELIMLYQPKVILEFGNGSIHSALCLARSKTSTCTYYKFQVAGAETAFATKIVKDAGMAKSIILSSGKNFKAFLHSLPDKKSRVKFDMVIVSSSVEKYEVVHDQLANRLHANTVIVCTAVNLQESLDSFKNTYSENAHVSIFKLSD